MAQFSMAPRVQHGMTHNVDGVETAAGNRIATMLQVAGHVSPVTQCHEACAGNANTMFAKTSTNDNSL